MAYQTFAIDANSGSLLGPVSFEAEEGLLGAVLLLGALPPNLKAEEFGIERFEKIYRTLQEMLETGIPLESISLVNALESRGLLEFCGGAGIALALEARTPSVMFVEQWAQLIKEKAEQRKIIQTAEGIIEEAIEGADGWRERVESAWPGWESTAIEEAGLRGVLSAIFDELEQRERQGYSLGFERLGNLIGDLEPSRFFILAGIPGTGKTALSLNIAANVAFQGGKVLFETLDMSPRQCVRRLISAFAGISLTHLVRRELSDREIGLLSSFLGALESAPLLFRQDRSLPRISARVRRLKPDLVIVDYLQLLSNSGRDKVQSMEDISQELKALSSDQPVWAISSLSREGNLKWSGDLDYDANVIIRLEEGAGELVTANVQKQKDGPTGSIPMLFFRPLQRFMDLREAQGAKAQGAKAERPRVEEPAPLLF